MADSSDHAQEYYKHSSELIKKAYESGSGIHTESSGDNVVVRFTVPKSALSEQSIKALTNVHIIAT
jgi:hypothetical protein